MSVLVRAVRGLCCGDRFREFRHATDGTGQPLKEVDASVPEFDASGYLLERLASIDSHSVFNIKIYQDAFDAESLDKYYNLCKDFPGLHVTTSCFSIWKKSKKTNACGKVVPAVSSKSDAGVKVFFFDDNLEWEGGETSPGICNLRDVNTGEFVEFGEGQNGFMRERAGQHTTIHYSKLCNTVLVKANILDAMADVDYFTGVIEKYSGPNDKVLVYMDVNSTIVCNDTVQGKELDGTLASVMFEFLEFHFSGSSFQLEWDVYDRVELTKVRTLKQLVKDLTGTNHAAYASFWTPDNCLKFVTQLTSKGTMKWQNQDGIVTVDNYSEMFLLYMDAIQKVIDPDGIASSWFKAYELLIKHGHTVVLNSFGVDTRKVVLATLHNESPVLQIAVNYELWDGRDVAMFEKQFSRNRSSLLLGPVRVRHSFLNGTANGDGSTKGNGYPSS